MSYEGSFPHAWETGIAEIDDDHRHLFKTLNEFIATDGKSLVDDSHILDWFLAELMNHFEKEERIMEMHGYRAAGEHRDHHRYVFKQLVALKDKNLSPTELAHECQKALIRDLLVKDLPFKEFMQKRKAAG
ncbi:bacteriohemerythrin [Kordiimonas lacus]|uniref:Hemerythrin-like metal-binding domain protein n=1 Tax=Kordiimonas lacus TaxID=637679 RepID=A0A1G7CNB1_9PROT|nr:hemerythrin domain-containing protein [Kordiimonas lacus]SDE39935.1 hemerythrin-like metal-binding domain protein [Kordiimonas lacus]